MMTNEQKFTLSNGVRVLVEELPHVQSAAIGFWVDVGSVLESTDENGVCHFIEHMLFKGTLKRSALEIAQSLEVSGGSLNAFTDKENTCFHARVLASEVELALDVIADMLINPLLDATELKREKAVVIEEIKMYEDTPDDLVHELLSEVVWEGHPLSQPITGTKGSVRRFDRALVAEFMRNFYTPDRLVVAVAGNVQAVRVLEQLERLLGNFKPGGKQVVEPPATPQHRQLVKYRPIEQVHLCVGTRGVAINDPKRYPVTLLNSILGGGMSSRLFQEVREKRGLVYAISSYDALYRAGGLFAVTASMSPKHLPQVMSIVNEELEKAKSGTITERELEQAKQQLKGSLLLSLEVPRHRMSRMAQNELYYGRRVSPEEVLADVEAVAIEDVEAVAREMFDAERYAITAVGPLRRLPAPLANAAVV